MKAKPKRLVEPFLWALFSAGGTVAAFSLPVVLILFGLAFPLGWLEPPSYEGLRGLIQRPPARLAVFLICWLSLFHWAHRFRYTLYDGLQIKHLNEVITVFCYGGALLGTGVAGYLLWNFR